MSDNICYRDAYLRAVPAQVLETDAGAVRLDRTVFYPGGGGQPADHGWLVAADGSRLAVTGATKRGDEIWHTVEGSPPCGRGIGLRRARLGSPACADAHPLRAPRALRRDLARLRGIGHRRQHGAALGPHGLRVRDDARGDLSPRSSERVNEEIAADREIRVNVLPRDEAFAIPDLIRTKINLLPEGITEVRTIEIVGLDLQADGGTHVAITREIGRVRVTGYESKGRINKRIRIEVLD